MEKQIKIYHGSEKNIIKPIFGEGKKNNDFGLGFYCTKDINLAKEWSVSSLKDGFANKYILNIEYLKILNLNSSEYTILNWIAILVEHRLFSLKSPVAQRAKKYLIDNFGKEFETKVVDEDHFIARVIVCTSTTFYRWIFGFCEKIRIIEPETVVTAYRRMLESALDKHE